MNQFFNKDKALSDLAKLKSGESVDGMARIGYNNDLTSSEVQTNEDAQKLLDQSKPETKMNPKMASAIGDVAGSLGGPTKTIDMGQYSTFNAPDEMAKLRMQVLENIKNRG